MAQRSWTNTVFNNVQGIVDSGLNLPSENDFDAGDKHHGLRDQEDDDWIKKNRDKWDFKKIAIAIRQRYLAETCKIPQVPPQAASHAPPQATTQTATQAPAQAAIQTPAQTPAQTVDDLPWRAPPKQRMYNNKNEFYEYIPLWTDPEFEAERKTGPRYFQGSLINRLYPAQTDESLAKNPTEMAKRYGIHPDRTDGRSRLSPKWSVSRRYQLKNGDWVDTSDLDRFLKENYYKSEAAKASGQSIDKYIKIQSQKVATKEEEQKTLEIWQICQKHNEELEKDEKYQRFLFDGYTTDELYRAGGLDFRNDVEFDLNGPLHELLTQNMWFPPDPDESTEDYPRQYYAFKDKNGTVQTGLWSAHDPLVWKALQPALQLLTRILNSNLPVWTGLLNLYTRLKIDLDRDPLADWLRDQLQNGHPFTCRNAWHNEASPPSTRSFPELLKLCATGFNTSVWTSQILRERLAFDVGSCNRLDGYTGLASSGTYGVSSALVDKSTGKAFVKVTIGAELVWPLLSIHTSKAEKYICSFAIAAVILHEMGHSVNTAQALAIADKTTLDYAADPIQRNLLGQACDRLFSRWEPFFEEETDAEVGYAVENQVFGGRMMFALRSSVDFQPVPVHFMMTQVRMLSWPYLWRFLWEKPAPESNRLLYPQASMIETARLMPSDAINQVFRQSFWSKDFAKYGSEALKTHGGRMLKKPPIAPDIFGRHWEVVYGRCRGWFLREATTLLGGAGYNTIMYYLESKARQRGVGIAARRFWHYEHKTWPRLNQNLDRAAKELREAAIKYLLSFDNATTQKPKPGRKGRMPLWYRNLQHARRGSFDSFVGKLMQLNRVLITRFEYIQSMLCTLARLQPADRAKIRQKHFGRLVNVIYKAPLTIMSRIKVAIKALIELYRVRVKYLRQGPYRGDSTLQPQLREDVKTLRKHDREFDNLEKMFRNHLEPLFRSEHSGKREGAGEFIALTSLNLSEESEVFREAAFGDINKIKDPDVEKLVKEALSIIEAVEKSDKKDTNSPSSPSSLASTQPPPSPRPGPGSSKASTARPPKSSSKPPPAKQAKGSSNKRRSSHFGYEMGHFGARTDAPPSKRMRPSGLEEYPPIDLPTSSCLEKIKYFEAPEWMDKDKRADSTALMDVDTTQPPPPGMIAVVDPRTGFTQYAPASRATEVGPMLQQAEQEREAYAAQARQALHDLQAQDQAPRRVSGLLTAGEQAAVWNLQSQETDFEVFAQRGQVIRAFDSLCESQIEMDEDGDVKMEL